MVVPVSIRRMRSKDRARLVLGLARQRLGSRVFGSPGRDLGTLEIAVVMTRKTVLTRRELERTALWLQLNKHYDSIMFVQKSANTGMTTWARFFNHDDPTRYEEIDVTDLDG